jgi:hypothetical protein
MNIGSGLCIAMVICISLSQIYAFYVGEDIDVGKRDMIDIKFYALVYCILTPIYYWLIWLISKKLFKIQPFIKHILIGLSSFVLLLCYMLTYSYFLLYLKVLMS